MLAHAGGDDGFAPGELEERPHGLLRLDVRTGFVPEGIVASPLGDLAVPNLGVGSGELLRDHQLVHAADRMLEVGADRVIDAFVFVVLRGVDVDMDDLRVRGELVDVPRDAVVETGTEDQQQVALVHGPVAIGRAVHAEPLHRQAVRLGEGAHAHECGGDGNVGAFGKREQFLVRARRDDAAAYIEHGPFRLANHLDDLPELLVVGMGGGGGIGAPKLDPGRIDRRELRLLHVLGNVDQHGAGPAALCEVEGLLEDARQVVDIEDEVAVFHDWQRQAVDVGFLKRHLADVLRINLAGDRHQRDRIHVGVGDRRNQVGGAGAAGGHAHADPAGGARVALGRKSATLLVTRQDHAKLAGTGERLMQFQRTAARIGKDHLDALPDETLDDGIGALDFRTDWHRGLGGGRGGFFHGAQD